MRAASLRELEEARRPGDRAGGLGRCGCARAQASGERLGAPGRHPEGDPEQPLCGCHERPALA
jgi:hypothetical protein